MSCPNETGCPLFPLFTMKASLRVWQDFYCKQNHEGCERYRLSRLGNRVPPNLLPNGKTLELVAREP